MQHAVQNASVNDGAAADSGADGQIQRIGEALRGAPARFSQRRRVDVGVDRDRHAERIANGASNVVVLPNQFWGRGDEAEGARVGM
jgi:hypothetical protein